MDEAKQLVVDHVRLTEPVKCCLAEAGGRVLAEDVSSPIELPIFDNSAMDGYALRCEDSAGAGPENPVSLKVQVVVAAGDDLSQSGLNALAPGSAAQIFTGAVVPADANAVIRQEDVELTVDGITIQREVRKSENIRFRSEEVAVGDILLRAGEKLSPAAIGMLATVGTEHVQVFERPRVGVVVTGSEIVPTSATLSPGKIFDSNSHVLAAALAEAGITEVTLANCADDRELLRETIAGALGKVDVLLVSGGVSVGKYDYVKDVVAELGIETVFWKIAQKPGKPLYFGASADRRKLVFGLPGNPASALVCFYEYVRPALMRAMGSEHPFLREVRARLQDDFSWSGKLTYFLKGKLAQDGSVAILNRQGSHMMSSFATATCLVVVPAGVKELKKGDDVEVHLLPG